jgi:hypothetical protein
MRLNSIIRMNALYYIVTCLNILCNCCNLHTKKTMYLLHLYFYIMSALVWKGDIFIYNCLIYFTADLFNESISKRLTTFNLFHHILMLIMLLLTGFTNIINVKCAETLAIYEISSIPLVLFYMGYLPKPLYNLIFSYTFIAVRLIYYNYIMYTTYLIDKTLFTNTVIGFYILLNIMNCGIAWKMKLVQKLFIIRPAIDYLCDKQPKTT